MIRTELTLRLQNSPGALARVCDLLALERVNVSCVDRALRGTDAQSRRMQSDRGIQPGDEVFVCVRRLHLGTLRVEVGLDRR